MNRLLSLMFKNRGYSPTFFQDIQALGHKAPGNIDEMCAALKELHDSGERIVLYTDHDMDGIMCGVIGFAGMAELGFNVSLFMPDISTGYGITDNAMLDVRDMYPDVKALMTADVGITADSAVAVARTFVDKILITDHHTPRDPIPDADVIVDPKQDGSEVFSDICGACVLYMVLRRYAELYGGEDSAFLVSQMDRLRVFAGFGTISDRMPVFYENRPLLKDMISICQYVYGSGDDTSVMEIPGCDIYRRCFRGLFIVLKVFADEKHINIDSITEDFIGFYVAPTFNSIKRMGSDIRLAYNVFFGSCEDAESSMHKLFELNDARKKLVDVVFDEMINSPQPWAPYVYISNGNPGFNGLLAQRCTEQTGRPVLVLNYTECGYSGSGRSPDWYPFLVYAGNDPRWEPAGHNGAFGITIRDEACVEEYVAFIEKDIKAKMPAGGVKPKADFVISSFGDGDTDIDMDLFEDFLYSLDVCRPFGPGFEAPAVILRFNPMDAKWNLFGGELEHVRAQLPRGLRLMCFNQGRLFGGHINPAYMPSVVEVVGTLSFNDYAGQRTIQFIGKFASGFEYTEVESYFEGLEI